ncbi:DUF4158 domain-containing protein [Streptomyces goshikiensis]
MGGRCHGLRWASAGAAADAEVAPAYGVFPRSGGRPETVVDFVRRAVELPEGTLPVYRAERTAKQHRGLVRKQAGVTYDQAKARQVVEQSIRKEAAAKNRPADLINIALEKVVEAGLELPGFSTFDRMASKIRTEVDASICAGVHDRMSAAQRAGLMRLLEERDSDGTTLFNPHRPAPALPLGRAAAPAGDRGDQQGRVVEPVLPVDRLRQPRRHRRQRPDRAGEGWEIDPEDLAHISPYLTEHVNRFGEYSTHELGIQPEAYDPKLNVDFAPLREQSLITAGVGQAA